MIEHSNESGRKVPLIADFHYRPEIDGLRAIAVLAVVFYHAGIGVSGGYIGVDVFFVISGFLITSLILKDLESGELTLINFWERRARRIIPAGLVMVLVVLITGWFLLLPSDYANLSKSAAWQSIFGANFYFWRSINYFTGPSDVLPLLHTWSLAVEEQFYLFVPLFLAGLFRFSRLRSRGVLLFLIGASIVISLGLSIYVLPRMPAVAFYLLPTRAWELLCGSLIALLPAVALGRSLREILTLLGLALIVIPCFLYTKQTPFPGLAALPPCVGTALFIWASRLPTDDLRIPTSALFLSTRPIVFVGLISYSLYLWHWPLFAFANYWALESLSVIYRLGLVTAGFVLSVISWRFVETPFRIRKLGTTRRSMFAYAGTGFAACVGMAVVLILNSGYPSRFSNYVLELDALQYQSEERQFSRLNVAEVLSGQFRTLKSTELNSIELLIWGDSHAGAILPAIESLADNHNVSVETAWSPSTPPVIRLKGKSQHSLKDDAPAVATAIVDHVQKERIPNVLLVACWERYFDSGSNSDRSDFLDAFEETIDSLQNAGATVWIFQQVPLQRVAVTKALIRSELFGTNIHHARLDLDSHLRHSATMLQLVPALQKKKVRFIDASNLLFSEDTGRLNMEVDGVPLYTDQEHLSKAGALLIEPVFSGLFY